MRIDQRRTPAQLGKLTGEFAGAVSNDVAHPAFAGLGDTDRARHYDREAKAGRSGTGNRVAVGEAPHLAEAPQPVDFDRLKRGKLAALARLGGVGREIGQSARVLMRAMVVGQS